MFSLLFLISISRINRSREALRKLQNYARNIIASSLDMIISVDLERRIVEFNKAAQETFGYRKDEVLGKPVDILYADPQETLLVSRLVSENGSCAREVTNKRKNGEIFQSFLSASILSDPRGNPQGVMGISRDITHQQQMQADLKRTSAQQSVLLENLDVGVVFLKDQHFIWLNTRMEELSGYSHEELKTLSLKTFYESRKAFYHTTKVASQVLARGETYRRESMFERKDGTMLWCHIAGKALDPRHLSQGTIWIIEDVTEQKRSEEHLQCLNQQLQQANRLKSEFLASMSHELRTPLNAMIGYTSLTLNALKESLPSEHLQNLIKAEQSARILLELINDVLDFSKIEAGRMEIFIEEINPSDIFDELISTAEGLIGDSPVELHEEFPQDLPMIESDYTRIKQIISNLTSNAIKFTHAGYVAIRAQVFSDEQYLRVEVADTGCGIPEENVAHIFALFTQADGSLKKKFSGTGLGLAITKKLCQMLQIEIGFETEVNQGTLFWLHIPFHFSAGEAATDADSPSESLITDFEEPVPVINLEGGTHTQEDSPITKPPLFFETKMDSKALILCFSMQELPASLARHLSGFPLEVREFDSVSAGIALCDSAPVWTILVPPNEAGFEAFMQLKRETSTRNIPLMLCSPAEAQPGVYIAPVECVCKPGGKERIVPMLRRIAIPAGDILIFERDPSSGEQYEENLEKAGYTPHVVRNNIAAVEILREIDLLQALIFDITMPELDGFRTLKELQTYPKGQRTPVIFVTNETVSTQEREYFQAGMQLLHNEESHVSQFSSWSEFIAHSIPLVGIRSVIVVDDNEMNLNLMSSVLKNAGYQVYEAQSGPAGITLAREMIPGMVLMDLAMPEMDGFEATQQLKHYPETQHIPVIACSAFAMYENKVKAAQAGCEGYITKPIEPARLIEQVAQYAIRSKIRKKIDRNT